MILKSHGVNQIVGVNATNISFRLSSENVTVKIGSKNLNIVLQAIKEPR